MFIQKVLKIQQKATSLVLISHCNYQTTKHNNHTPHRAKSERPIIHTMQGMNMLTLKEFNEQQIEELIWTALDLKAIIKKEKSIEVCDLLQGESLAAIFQKRSTRTRFAFESGAHSLGAHAIFCNKDDIHLGVSESVKDTTLVLSRLSNLIAARVYEHSLLEEMCKYSTVPIVNALSDEHHPTQALADLMTIYEHFGHLKGLRVAWVGDGNNILSSLLIACTKMKMHFSSSTPIGYAPCVETLSYAEKMADINGTKISISTSPEKAVKDADIIITDTWISMGQEDEKVKRLKAFDGYQITLDMLNTHAKKNWIFLHCLPRKKEEVCDNVFYHKRSLVFDEAENRKWTTMSVLANLMKGYTPRIITEQPIF